MKENIRQKLQEENITYNPESNEINFSSAILEAIKLIPDQAKNVLDVGCGIGTGKLIADKFRPGIAEYHGIEFHKSAAPLARKNIQYFRETDIEGIAEDAFPENYFDVIMFNDVLEHLVYPELSLKTFIRFLKRDGVLITSLPNVSHQSVLMNLLLNGLWTDQGIALKEHLHFFTFNEITELINSAGLYPEPVVIAITSEPEAAMRAILKTARPWMKRPYKQAVFETEVVQYVIRSGFSEKSGNFEFIPVPNTMHSL